MALGENMQKFDLIVPSGSFCVTSYHLRQARRQGEALPFDWLENVTPELFAGFMESGFQDFLELKQLIPDGERKEGEPHCRFKMPNGIVFVHDFVDCNPQTDFASVRKKYDRRIERLNAKIAKARTILFVHCSRAEADEHMLRQIYRRLAALYPKKSIKFLYVHLVNGKHGFDYVSKTEGFDIVDMEFGTNSDPKQFWIGNVPVFNQMLSSYRLTFRARFGFWCSRWKRKFSKNYDKM